MKRHLCSSFGRINIGKMVVLSKAICRFSTVLMKIPKTFFHRNRTDLFGNHKRPQIANENLRKGSKAGGIMRPNFRS